MSYGVLQAPTFPQHLDFRHCMRARHSFRHCRLQIKVSSPGRREQQQSLHSPSTRPARAKLGASRRSGWHVRVLVWWHTHQLTLGHPPRRSQGPTSLSTCDQAIVRARAQGKLGTFALGRSFRQSSHEEMQSSLALALQSSALGDGGVYATVTCVFV